MPAARNGPVSLHYEGTGTGTPVLLVMGLGMNATGWWRTVPVLAAAELRVLTFDNRGVGRSDRPPYNYSTRSRAQHGDRIVQDIRERLRYPLEPEPYAAQLAAAFGHDTYDRLARIRAPTLVVHGQEDVMVPPANGRLLASLIPRARLLELRRAAHLYPTDETNADHEIASFLSASAG